MKVYSLAFVSLFDLCITSCLFATKEFIRFFCIFQAITCDLVESRILIGRNKSDIPVYFSSGLAGSSRNFDSFQQPSRQSDSGGVSKVTSTVLFDFELSSQPGLLTFQFIAEWTTMSITESPAPLAPASAAASTASSPAPAVYAPVPVPERLSDELLDAALTEPGYSEALFLGIVW